MLAPVIEYRFDYPVHPYLKSDSDINNLYLGIYLALTLILTQHVLFIVRFRKTVIRNIQYHTSEQYQNEVPKVHGEFD